MYCTSAETFFGSPGNRAAKRIVDLERACAVAKAPKSLNIVIGKVQTFHS